MGWEAVVAEGLAGDGADGDAGYVARKGQSGGGEEREQVGDGGRAGEGDGVRVGFWAVEKSAD